LTLANRRPALKGELYQTPLLPPLNPKSLALLIENNEWDEKLPKVVGGGQIRRCGYFALAWAARFFARTSRAKEIMSSIITASVPTIGPIKSDIRSESPSAPTIVISAVGDATPLVIPAIYKITALIATVRAMIAPSLIFLLMLAYPLLVFIEMEYSVNDHGNKRYSGDYHSDALYGQHGNQEAQRAAHHMKNKYASV
jgi:hypothetical protein